MVAKERFAIVKNAVKFIIFFSEMSEVVEKQLRPTVDHLQMVTSSVTNAVTQATSSVTQAVTQSVSEMMSPGMQRLQDVSWANFKIEMICIGILFGGSCFIILTIVVNHKVNS